MTRLPPVLLTADLSDIDLQASRLDGELERMGAGYVSPMQATSREVRARSLIGIMAATATSGNADALIAERETAAWIYGATDDVPAAWRFCVATNARRSGALRHVQVREVVIDRHDIHRIAGIAVTSPARTALDLCRLSAAWSASSERTLVTLLDVTGVDPLEVESLLRARRNLPDSHRALTRLASAERLLRRRPTRSGQPALTRYTS